MSMRLLVLVLGLCLLSGCAAVVVGGAAAGAGAAHDRRTFGTVLDDNNVELTAYELINKDKELALKNNVAVVVHNGVLLLFGEVRREELKQRAEQLVTGFKGIRRVVNEIVVTKPTGFGTSARDAWITARVKLGLLNIVNIQGFDPTRVNVTTQNGTVYLMGLVTQEESTRVIEVARDTAGVKKVVNVFEYID
jgi:osmotically-inducible protein OsmY